MASKDLSYEIIILRVLCVLCGYLFFTLITPTLLAFTFKSPTDLDQMIKEDQGDLLIIDIRPATQFNKKSIFNSINISPILLKNKTFLKNKKIVLVDGGIDYCTTQKLAADLTQNGFSHIYALEGGIRYYQYKKKKLQIIEDSLEARYGLTVVSLQKVLHCKTQNPLLIDIRDEASFQRNRIPVAINLHSAETDDLIKYINQQEVKDETKSPVILLDARGKHTPRLARLLSRRGINAYYLIDGMESWDLYVKEIPAARKRENLTKECKECEK